MLICLQLLVLDVESNRKENLCGSPVFGIPSFVAHDGGALCEGKGRLQNQNWQHLRSNTCLEFEPKVDWILGCHEPNKPFIAHILSFALYRAPSGCPCAGGTPRKAFIHDKDRFSGISADIDKHTARLSRYCPVIGPDQNPFHAWDQQDGRSIGDYGGASEGDKRYAGDARNLGGQNSAMLWQFDILLP